MASEPREPSTVALLSVFSLPNTHAIIMCDLHSPFSPYCQTFQTPARFQSGELEQAVVGLGAELQSAWRKVRIICVLSYPNAIMYKM